jgi:hypothetical protein
MDIDFTMNERIKELAEEAVKAVQSRPNGICEMGKYNQKFAELIMEECIGKVTKVSDSIKEFDPDNADGIDLCDLITYHIKKHFGVEE